ncbi:MAG: hypothetical protein AB1750_17170, partial [Chloroflexota bacterium]
TARTALFGSSEVTASQAAEEFGRDVTMTAYDLAAMQGINAALNDLVVALSNVDQSAVAEARAYAQSYTSVFQDVPPSYIDLGHFLDLLIEVVGDPAVSDAAQNVKSAIAQSVLAEMHGPERPGSTGISIYFPNSDLYSFTFNGDGPAYTAFAGRFATASLWDDFLTFHYTGEPFDPASADLAVLTPAESHQTDFTDAAANSAPDPGAALVIPGSGEITIEPLTLSTLEVGPDESINIATTITGSNIGYVYYFVSYYDPDSDSFLTADMGFIAAEQTREVGGIFYPDWGDGPISIDFDWEPTLYFMSDGNEDNDQFAFFEPTVYGVDVESDVYTVRGLYTFAGTGTEVYAEMDFDGYGNFLSVFGFEGDGGTGAPHEITPQPGDQFTIYEEWLEFDTNPDGEFVDYLGGTMTFGDQPFFWQPYYAYAGDYILGILVEDLNGNIYFEYALVTVTE